jgi:hypothetical protein
MFQLQLLFCSHSCILIYSRLPGNFVVSKMTASVSVANKNKADIQDGNEYKIRKWLLDTCSSCHVTIMGSQKSRLKCARFLYKIHVTLQCIVVSALKKTSKVNTILKVVIFKHSVILLSVFVLLSIFRYSD